MRKPKAWVFTGWVLHTWDVDDFSAFAREKMLKLFHILKDTKFGATTEFSIHMEIKFNNDGSVYLHWHVVMGGIKCRISTMRTLWGRVVKYEQAISKMAVASYVSKYASKTPDFIGSEFNQDWYHLVVYKAHMHRFSVSKNKAMESVPKPEKSFYYSYNALVSEAKFSYWDSYLNPKSDENYYHPLLEPPPEKPKRNLDFYLEENYVES